MAQKRKITDKNLYEMLDLLSSATEQEIKKAYRKKALKCHPDKNPDNPKAAELFHELSDALEILLDEKARAAYDRTLKAKEQAKERLKELDSKRRKFREDLERREQAAKEAEKERQAAKRNYSANLSEEEAFQREVERLRKEGSRALQEEQELIKQQILKEQQGKFSFLSATDAAKPEVEGPRIKVKWAKGENPRSYDSLMKKYSKYGKVTTLVVGKKCAIVEFQNQSDADRAFDGESDDAGVQLEWMSKSKPEKTSGQSQPSNPAASGGPTSTFPSFTPPPPSMPGLAGSNPSQPMSARNFADFEAMILGRLSAAAAAQKQNAAAEPSTSE